MQILAKLKEITPSLFYSQQHCVHVLVCQKHVTQLIMSQISTEAERRNKYCGPYCHIIHESIKQELDGLTTSKVGF